MEKIDFVLPWVDGNDIKWQKSKKRYSPNNDDDGDAPVRFRDMNTLKYVLRSIEKNCPWYNKIFLITEGHYPSWLNIDHERVELITHQELYYDKSHLPIFNSSSIEMNLSNLYNRLSDKFVYLNDDMIIFRKVSQDRFFKKDLPVDFLSHGWIPRNKYFGKLRRMDSWVHSINNNLKLINQKFSPLSLSKETLYHRSYSTKTKISNFLLDKLYRKYIWLGHWHHPQPYLKETLKEVYGEFKEAMMHCSSNKFRDNSDLTQYLYRYWHLTKQKFYPYDHKDGLIANIDSKTTLEYLLNQLRKNSSINFVCFNDDLNLSEEEYIVIKHELNQFLEAHFLQKASFEK